MKKLTGILGFMVLSFLVSTGALWPAPIIVDHNAVDEFDQIPDEWIDEVKKMVLSVVGESHSAAYREGLIFLAQQSGYEKYTVDAINSNLPQAATDLHLRMIRGGAGEAQFWTSDDAQNWVKTRLTAMNNASGGPVHAFGFGWCWDLTSGGPYSNEVDPVYKCRWYGRSHTINSGNLGPWGLDSGDAYLTNNPVNMQTYLDAVEEYNRFSPETVTFFTTGPVEGSARSGEAGYQRYLKHGYMRDHVKASENGVLFDYADILCWDSSEQQTTTTWTDGDGQVHTYQTITAESLSGGGVGHIGANGAIRLAKGLWWMMARIAGWGGDWSNTPPDDNTPPDNNPPPDNNQPSDNNLPPIDDPVIIEDNSIHVENSVIKNPGSSQASINFVLQQAGTVSVKIYDAKGAEITTLFYGYKNAGPQSFSWRGIDASGSPVGSGIYIVHIQAGSQTATKKVAVIK